MRELAGTPVTRNRRHEQEESGNDSLETLSNQEKQELLAAFNGRSRMDQMRQQAEAEQLQAENEEMRQLIVTLREELEQAAATNASDAWLERERKYESTLEEKSEEIRELYMRIQEMEKECSAAEERAPVFDADEESQAMLDELQREAEHLQAERQRLEDERRQLRDDEDGLMERMREMELHAAKGRADLARQRNELQQMHTALRQEIEQAQQRGAANERLSSLRQQQQDVAKGRQSR